MLDLGKVPVTEKTFKVIHGRQQWHHSIDHMWISVDIDIRVCTVYVLLTVHGIAAVLWYTAPHQPRLDWQMWFAALGSYQHNPWFLNLVYRLLMNEPEGLNCTEHIYVFGDRSMRINKEHHAQNTKLVILVLKSQTSYPLQPLRNFCNFPKRKLWFPGHQLSWVSEWLSKYMIFVHGLAQRRWSRKKWNFAQR